MKGKFPVKLYNFTFSGRNFKHLHNDILMVILNLNTYINFNIYIIFNFNFFHITRYQFLKILFFQSQGMKSPHLHFGLHNTSISTIHRDLFTNAISVRNITIDLYNNDVRTLMNPSSAHKPSVPGKRFLMRLRMAGSHLNCDCDIG